jgi:ribosomal protein S18 acetylase RimI-like enzyme
LTDGAAHLIRRLGRTDVAAYRVVRLMALQRHPEAFSSSYEEESQLDLDGFAHLVPDEPPGAAMGAFDGSALVGIAKLFVPPRLKQRHNGTVVGVYVDPAFRRTGLARSLMQSVIEEARQAQLVSLRLTVTVGNDSARRLYAGLGYQTYGVDRRALKVDGRYYDDELMVLDLA